jgi:glycerol-3-phosphate dehydrogenase (NAD(P)+)
MGYIAVLGGGAWGTTLANLLCSKGYDTALWALEPEVAESITKRGVNEMYLPGVRLAPALRATTDLARALDQARYVVSVIPTQHTRAVMERAHPLMDADTVIVSASKGIENGTYLTVSGIVKKTTGRECAVLSGPSFAAEVTKRLPTAVTLAASDYSVALMLQELFTTDFFRVYTHHDILGVELGGALKNVMAVASGISEGLGLGNSARSALITRGLAEMVRLGMSMGAREQTFSGLSGLGDLVLTCSSPLSRNYTVGYELGQGRTIAQVMEGKRTVAEGVHTARAAFELARMQSVDMPIVAQVYKVINEDKPAADAVADLMTRAPKPEFHGRDGQAPA